MLSLPSLSRQQKTSKGEVLTIRILKTILISQKHILLINIPVKKLAAERCHERLPRAFVFKIEAAVYRGVAVGNIDVACVEF
jgi:hypothetical protein